MLPSQQIIMTVAFAHTAPLQIDQSFRSGSIHSRPGKKGQLMETGRLRDLVQKQTVFVRQNLRRQKHGMLISYIEISDGTLMDKESSWRSAMPGAKHGHDGLSHRAVRLSGGSTTDTAASLLLEKSAQNVDFHRLQIKGHGFSLDDLCDRSARNGPGATLDSRCRDRWSLSAWSGSRAHPERVRGCPSRQFSGFPSPIMGSTPITGPGCSLERQLTGLH